MENTPRCLSTPTRKLLVPGDREKTLHFCAEHFVTLSQEAVLQRGRFTVALSGGSTPQALFTLLTHPPYQNKIEWSKVHLLWSDERNVPLDHPESNYKMAMEAGFNRMPIPSSQIYPLLTNKLSPSQLIQQTALYQKLLQDLGPLDLVMLGMGEDGHTASLFPGTEALKATEAFIFPNFIPSKNTWRMTMTFPGIHHSHNIALYVLGSSKQKMLYEIFSSPSDLPVAKVGTPSHKAFWIVDQEAATLLFPENP